ncbi:helix-turn-helix domain-containing protein [Kitasatospora sp. NPDC094015]|uniref:helix-turn-helix domain-containing protein n=1 Tax=Kitasatospora sp. NPDC094015 TaxID=3155205 RepID=UPI0033225954
MGDRGDAGVEVDPVPGDGAAELPEPPDPEAERLGRRIEFLFGHVQPLGRRFTLQEVADGIREQGRPGDPRISVGRLWTLVKGRAANPTIGTLRALGEFFGVPQAYFIDDEVAERVSAQLALIAAMRANDVRSVALRAAAVATMSSHGLETVRSLVEHSGAVESGLAAGSGPAAAASTAPATTPAVTDDHGG